MKLEKFIIFNCEKYKGMAFTVKPGSYEGDLCIQFTCNECGYIHTFTLDTLKLSMFADHVNMGEVTGECDKLSRK